MADEPTKFILGDTAISAAEEPGRKRFFRRKNQERRTLSRLTHCENCGAQLSGRYCAQCGQAAIDYRRSFRHVIIDVLDSFLNWDSKFFATIGLLIAKPWRLTNEFLAGMRIRYVHPLRLYLLASFLFFFAVNYGARGLHLEPGKLGP
jgi:ribosomal protein L32